MRMGRIVTQWPADVLSHENEGRAAYLIQPQEAAPTAPPPLGKVVGLIVAIGGFLGRKGDGEPGGKTLWLDLRDIAVFVDGIRAERALL